ncbi:hypothetical protein ACK8HX_00115 [Oryzobacter sp. R7]|uniref:hypothetical protein n=1 Tax=Oryzobacter faecalis TaxID=3388656 RepID=UPI00398D1102
MSTSQIWTTVKDELRARREARERAAALRADLAHYRTPAEIDDLLAAVDQQEGPEADLIRSVLSDNLRAWQARVSA